MNTFSVAPQLRLKLRSPHAFALLGVLLGPPLGVLIAMQPAIGVGLPLLALLLIIVLPRPKWGLYMIAGWLPFESLAVFDVNFSATKLVAIITFAGWLMSVRRTKSSPINWGEAPVIWLFLFLGAASASLIGAGQFGIGFVQLTTLFMLVALYFMIIDLVDDEPTLTVIVKILLAASLLAALIGISQFISGGLHRAWGAYGDPNGSALSLAVLGPLAISFLWSPGSRKIIFWGTLLILLAGVIVTTSRGGIVALLAGLILSSREKLLDKRVRIRIAALLVVLAVVIGSMALFLDKRLTLGSILATKGAGRFDIWATGLKMLPDHWLLGVGLANYKFIYIQYSYLMPNVSPVFRKPLGGHNVFLEIAVETGIIGLFFLIGFFGSVLNKTRQSRSAFLAAGDLGKATHSSMFTISIITFLVAFLALGALYMKIVWLIMALASCRALAPPPQNSKT